MMLSAKECLDTECAPNAAAILVDAEFPHLVAWTLPQVQALLGTCSQRHRSRESLLVSVERVVHLSRPPQRHPDVRPSHAIPRRKKVVCERDRLSSGQGLMEIALAP